MELTEFLKLNIGIIAVIFLIVMVYLIILINKRRKEKFLHRNAEKKEKEEKP